jgi:hypothetical protein
MEKNDLKAVLVRVTQNGKEGSDSGAGRVDDRRARY